MLSAECRGEEVDAALLQPAASQPASQPPSRASSQPAAAQQHMQQQAPRQPLVLHFPASQASKVSLGALELAHHHYLCTPSL